MEPAEERHGLARTGVTKGSTWNIRTGLRARGRGCEAKFGRLVGDGGGGWYAGGMILRGDNAGGRGSRPPSDGVTAAMPTGDADCDGDWDATDAADIGSNYTPGSAYAVRRDTDLDGDVDAADVTHANGITGGYQSLGRDVLTSAAVRNRIGYAGYQYDPTFAGLDRHLSHVRHRVYDAELGRWTRRDPLGYVDGAHLYSYVSARPHVTRDPAALASARCVVDATCEAPPHVPQPLPSPPLGPPLSDPNPPPPPAAPGQCAVSTCPGVIQNPVLPAANGCGRKGQWYIPNILFLGCCNAHDTCYLKCGTTRSACDAAFCTCMTTTCYTLPFQAIIPCLKQADLYCEAVAIFGGDAFCSAQEVGCRCCDARHPSFDGYKTCGLPLPSLRELFPELFPHEPLPPVWSHE